MSEWISVDERLPDLINSWCLVYADGAINCMMLDREGFFYDATHSPCHNVRIEDITHWMPLPEPPKEQ